MKDYGINRDGDGTFVGLWFKPGTIQRDDNEYWFITLGELRELVNGITTTAWDASL